MTRYNFLSPFYVSNNSLKHEFDSFWEDYLKNNDKKLLFIIGLGFDPRMLNCIETISSKNKSNSIKLMTLSYVGDNETSNELMINLSRNNEERLNKLFPRVNWNKKQIELKNNELYVGSINAANSISSEEINDYTDIVIDVSAIPYGIYFPLLSNILDILISENSSINLHVVVSENIDLDRIIIENEQFESGTYLHRFTGTLHNETDKELEKVWIPMVGENTKSHMSKIYDFIKQPKEICPIFPLPSTDPYRMKKLLKEHREFLFEVSEVETGNFIYSDEQNPFETYKKIYSTAKQYYTSFEPEGCHVILSPLSSKLLSIGAFLAAYDLKSDDERIGVAYVESQGHEIASDTDVDEISKKSKLFSLWIYGEAYNA